MNTKTCRNCGNPVARGAQNQPLVFCSDDCNKAWRAQRWVGNKLRRGMKPVSSFEKGHSTWNKNLKGIHLSEATEFKRGDKPPCTLPIGAVTVRIDKAGKPRAWVKIADPPKWICRSAFNWTASGRTIPYGYVLHHADRNTLNDAIENLHLLTRREHIAEHRKECRSHNNQRRAMTIEEYLKADITTVPTATS